MKVNTNDYWQWATQEKGQKRLESYPYEIAEKFESYGFIWGGKWNHFDIMHYEYRPEIIFKAKYFSEYYTEPKLGNSSNQPEDNTQKQRASWHKSMTDDLPTALTYANQIDILFK